MVLAYNPQRMKLSLDANSNYPPQGIVGAGAIGPTTMQFNVTLEIMEFNNTLETMDFNS